jgi:hypothetical protein
MRPLMMFCLLVGAVIGFSGCSDDSNSSGSDSARVQSAVDGVNAANESVLEASCDCYSAATGEDKQQCIAENAISPVELTDCERIAANCDSASYEAFMGCQEDGLHAYRDCISTCPSTSQREQCDADFNAKVESCAGGVTQVLDDAFGQCNQGQTPSCGGSSGGGSGGGGGGGNIEQVFVDKYWMTEFDTSWIPPSFAWNQRELDADSSTRYAYLRVKSDGTYTYAQNWPCLSCTYGPIVTHESGTWSISGDQITINDGCGRTYTHPISLQDDRVVIGMLEWRNSPNADELFDATMDSASADCIGDLPSSNPQKK